MKNPPALFASLLMAGWLSLSPTCLQADAPMPPNVNAETNSECLMVLRHGLKSDQFWPSMHAAEALTQAGHGSEVINALKDRLSQEQDLQKRCGIARELVRAGDRSKVAELQAILANPDSYGHVHACESLFKVKEVGNLSLMQAAMQDGANPVKALMAAGALTRQGDAEALTFIREQLQSQDSRSRWIAAWLLGSLGELQDIDAVRAALARSETPREKAYFENTLGMLGDTTGQEALLANLKHPDVSVRADAAYLAGEAHLPQAQEQLKALLKDENLDVGIRAAQGLLALSREKNRKPEAAPVTVVSRMPAKATPSAPVVTLTLSPGPGNSRNSEGDFIHTKDGRTLFIYTYFGKGTGSDYDTAELRERVSTDGGQTWSKDERTVVKPASGLNVMSVSLLRLASGEIALFYLSKISHSDCRPEMRISTDEGKTWGPVVQCVRDEIDYYVLNNSRAIQLKSGRIVLPMCLHRTIAEKKNDWAGELLCYFSDDKGQTWKRSKSVFKGHDANGKRLTVQEPGVVELKDGRVMMFIRSSSGSQMLSYSEDGGDTWSDPVTSNIISPLSPASIKRIPKTGDLLLVWNDHSAIPAALKGKRTPLSIAISKDEGKTWERTKKLYDDPNGWYCYIAIDVSGDDVLLGHCAGDSRKNGLTITDVMLLNLDWLYNAE